MSRGRTAYSSAHDGDLRSDHHARSVFAATLGISDRWATIRQVHGAVVVEVAEPGDAGHADGLFTLRNELPVAVFTADCLAVALVSETGVGMAHAGWRGLAAGVVDRLRSRMTEAGAPPTSATIGPGIGPCCFEVGDDVLEQFPGYETQTTWGTRSVDLGAVARRSLTGLSVSQDTRCTRCGEGFFSHRRTGTSERMAGVAWLP